jgi:TolB-like protein/Tfp pilus assembly protein PilF
VTVFLGVLAGYGIYRLILPAPSLNSLAVLPFASIGADPEVEYLADGLSDSIIDRMSRLKEVKVIAWQSVSRYKGRPVEARRVGRDLNVRAVLAGRVGYRAGELQVHVELIDAGDNTRLWGEQYREQFSEVFSIQDAIARRISESLRLHLARDEQERLARRPTSDPVAYKLYLRGRHMLLSYSTQDDIRRAIDYFNQAIAIDPNYARAYVGIADSHYYLSNLYLPPAEAMPRARAAALKALELDESLGWAHASLGVVKQIYEWDFEGARRELRRAIELAPSDVWAHLMLGLALAASGAADEAGAEIARALELDPLSPFVRAYGAFALYYARRYERAASELKTLLAEEPDYYLAHAYLGLVYEQTGQLREAVEQFRTATGPDETPEALAQLGHACAIAGDRAEAHRILGEIQRMSVSRYVSPFNFALIHAGLGDRDQAFAWLDRAIEDHSEWIHTLGVDPRLEHLRDDPRFQALLQRVGQASRP